MQTQLETRDVPEINCMGLVHKGPYNQIGPTFQKLGELITQAQLWGKVGMMRGIYRDNPNDVPADQLTSYACVEILDETVEWPAELLKMHFKGGKAAVLAHKGPYEQLPDAWMAISEAVYGPNSSFVPAPGFSRGEYSSVDFENPDNNVTELMIFVQ